MSFFGKVNFSFRHSYSTHTHRDLLPPTTFSPHYMYCPDENHLVDNTLTVLSLRAGTRYFYPATVASGTGRKNKNKKNHVQNSS
jgi:hypothetical protein